MSRVQDMKNKANAFASKIMGSNCYIVVVYLVSIIFLVILTYINLLTVKTSAIK